MEPADCARWTPHRADSGANWSTARVQPDEQLSHRRNSILVDLLDVPERDRDVSPTSAVARKSFAHAQPLANRLDWRRRRAGAPRTDSSFRKGGARISWDRGVGHAPSVVY